MCGCVYSMCVRVCEHPALQTSAGHAAQALNQHKTSVQQRSRRECFVRKPAEEKTETHPAVFASHWRCPSALERPCCRAAAPMTRQDTDAVSRRSFTTVLSGTSPLPLLSSAPLCIFLVSLQDQIQLNLRFHAGTSRFTVQ